MLISSDRGGGEIMSSAEDTRFYDDIGCLAADWSTHHGDAHEIPISDHAAGRVAIDPAWAGKIDL